MERMMMVGVLLGALLSWPTTGVGQVTNAKAAGAARQQQWLAATTQERVRLAEALGEDGARAMARAKGYEVIYDGLNRTLPQGADQVYRAPDGRVLVYEAKGGSSHLGKAYGHSQGSSEWAVESAKRVLRSQNAGPAERSTARVLLEAAAKGKMEVHVVRTSHVLGEPTAAVLESVAKTSDDAARLARSALDDVASVGKKTADGAARAAEGSDDAAKLARNAKFTRTATRGLVVVGVAVDAANRVSDASEVERQFEAGEISADDREIAHVKNAAGMAGGWGGAYFGAKLGALGGGAAGTCVAPGPGSAVGAVAGGAVGGVGGYFGGEAAAEAAAEWTMTRIHNAGTSIQGTWKWVWGD